MVDLGFEEDIREVLSFFKGQRQMLMFRCVSVRALRCMCVVCGAGGRACSNSHSIPAVWVWPPPLPVPLDHPLPFPTPPCPHDPCPPMPPPSPPVWQRHHARQDQVVCRVGAGQPGDGQRGARRRHQPGHHPGGGWGVQCGVGCGVCVGVTLHRRHQPGHHPGGGWGVQCGVGCGVCVGVTLHCTLALPEAPDTHACKRAFFLPNPPHPAPSPPHVTAGGGVREGGSQACLPARVPTEDGATRAGLCGCAAPLAAGVGAAYPALCLPPLAAASLPASTLNNPGAPHRVGPPVLLQRTRRTWTTSTSSCWSKAWRQWRCMAPRTRRSASGPSSRSKQVCEEGCYRGQADEVASHP